MRKQIVLQVFITISVFVLSGCVVRSYQVTRDRIDQDLTTGNRGYLQGKAPEPGERKMTRDMKVVEVELYSPIKFAKTPAQQPVEKTEQAVEGNRGYVAQNYTPEANETGIAEKSTQEFKEYTVQKGDTLQKISKHFYGTTKRWKKIYDANADVLKAPNKIYPGQVIKVPVTAGLKTQGEVPPGKVK